MQRGCARDVSVDEYRRASSGAQVSTLPEVDRQIEGKPADLRGLTHAITCNSGKRSASFFFTGESDLFHDKFVMS